MVRTKASGVKVGGKASRKVAVLSRASSGGAGGSKSGFASGKALHIGDLSKDPTPEWQKGIDKFFPKLEKSKSTEDKENSAPPINSQDGPTTSKRMKKSDEEACEDDGAGPSTEDDGAGPSTEVDDEDEAGPSTEVDDEDEAGPSTEDGEDAAGPSAQAEADEDMESGSDDEAAPTQAVKTNFKSNGLISDDDD